MKRDIEREMKREREGYEERDREGYEERERWTDAFMMNVYVSFLRVRDRDEFQSHVSTDQPNIHTFVDDILLKALRE